MDSQNNKENSFNSPTKPSPSAELNLSREMYSPISKHSAIQQSENHSSDYDLEFASPIHTTDKDAMIDTYKAQIRGLKDTLSLTK